MHPTSSTALVLYVPLPSTEQFLYSFVEKKQNVLPLDRLEEALRVLTNSEYQHKPIICPDESDNVRGIRPIVFGVEADLAGQDISIFGFATFNSSSVAMRLLRRLEKNN